MSVISIENLSFEYEGGIDKVFENVSVNLDTDWKLGLIGRNGKGKTTLFKLLMGEYEYKGKILSIVNFEYFPYKIINETNLVIDIISEKLQTEVELVEEWKIIKEFNLIELDLELLYRKFSTLSGGEKVKVMLVTLFLKQNSFLLIDEPTNHLDELAIKQVIKYLKAKKGYIVVSHNRTFLDETVDHILSINNTGIQVSKGNYSIWKNSKDRTNLFEQKENEKLINSINKFKVAKKNTQNWADMVEKSKIGDSHADKGYIGHKSAKMMKTSKNIERRIDKNIAQKEELLKDVDNVDKLVMKPLVFEQKEIVLANKLSIKYVDKIIVNNLNLQINVNDRVAITGRNGSGKSSLLKLIIGETIQHEGKFKLASNVKVSYVSQNTDNLRGTLGEYAKLSNVEESIFYAMLVKLGISNQNFSKDIANFSEGQKKKILIARSLSQSAHLYVWDEPLNFIDILSREQIEECILKYSPTIIFVEHDSVFVNKIATKVLALSGAL